MPDPDETLPETPRCANCGAERTAAYCEQCGQSGAIRRSLWAVVKDAAAGVWRDKPGRTLLLLAGRPGQLTRRYAAGERARFGSPVVVFLIATLLLFAAGSIGSAEFQMVPEGPRARTALAADRARVGVRIERLEAQRAAATADKDWQEASALRRDLRGLRADMRRLDRVDRMLRRLEGGSARARADGLVETGWPFLDDAIATAAEEPRLVSSRLIGSAYALSWVLIPVTLPLIWLMFAWRRDVGPYHHAVFALYSLGFMTLFGVALLLLSAAGMAAGWLALAMLIVPPVHMFAQLRGGYALGIWGATWRTAALIATTLAASALLALLLFGLTID